MISINNLTVRFSGSEIFNNITFFIGKKDRIGLIGRNGAGKSTLLKVITGQVQPDEGNVSINPGIRIGYLPQQMIYPEGRTVWNEALTAFDEIDKINNDIEQLNNLLAQRTDYESAEYMNIIDKLTELTELHKILGGNNKEADVEITLKGLGFKPDEFHKPTSQFSGGWRMRIELAKLILRKPDVFLLDEPTNHLDIESIQWFEDFLKDFQGAMLIISHDKTFLDNLTNRTVEISLGKLYDFSGKYSDFVEYRKQLRQQQLAAYENQQKYIKDTERFIERFRYKATKAVQVQSRIKKLEKLERIEIEQDDTRSIHFRFPPAPRSGDIVVETIGISKSFGQKKVLENIDFILERGEKIAFVGRNGEGKTTLAKIITGNLDFTSGKIKFGHNVKIGYYAQNQDELLDMNKTVFQTLDDIATGDIRTKLRDILGAFLFGGEDIDKKVKVLSGGERSRLAMATLLLKPYNLLVLDEPTNHLDMLSKEILKKALVAYDGSLILVSHDRDFLDGLVDTVYEFGNKKIKQHKGGVFAFLERKRIEHLNDLDSKQIYKKKTETTNTKKSNKEEYLKRKEKEKALRKIKKQIERIEQNIEKIENRLAEIDLMLQNPQDINPEIYEEYQALKHQLEAEMQNWETQNNILDEMNEE